MVRLVPSPWTLSLLSQQLQLPSFLDVVANLALLRDWLFSPYIVCLHAAPPAAAEPSLWAALLDLVTTADARGILVAVELPASDAGWRLPAGQAVQATCPFVTSFCFCAFGSPMRSLGHL